VPETAKATFRQKSMAPGTVDTVSRVGAPALAYDEVPKRRMNELDQLSFIFRYVKD
jgi:hypothetical protein